jgi:hypothetical protein
MRHHRCPTVLLLAFALLCTGILQAETTSRDWKYFPDRVIFKVATEYKVDTSPGGVSVLGVDHIDRFFSQIGVTLVEKTFPYCDPPLKDKTDLTRIYTVYFPASFLVEQICQDMAKLDGIEYAEPWFIYREFLDHNDPYRNLQYGLDLCQANDAHDISTGDRSVAVAIVDSGVDRNHVDLASNIWVNPGEDLNGNGRIDNNERNGEDDDRNGYNDDFNGWDFIGGDNNPEDNFGHGTHCAGIASAVTNNRIGVASVGYSCGIMAVKVGNGGTITRGYEGIEYAASTGAKVISCSWGGYERAQVLQEVINYAYDHDVMVLSSAGNDGITTISYPAGYEHVIAVAATNQNDRKSDYSNYGEWIDICAPGDEIISTVPGNDYDYMWGTSMSCPFAASVAVLIRAAYPWLDVDEATQLLLDGADDIDNLNRNFRGQLGSGRINAFNSLYLGIRPIINVEGLEIISDGNDNGRFDPGEVVRAALRLSNSEHAVEAETMTVFVSTSDETIDIRNPAVEIHNFAPGDVFFNSDEPFEIEIDGEAIPHTAYLLVHIEAEPGDVVVEKEIEIVIGQPNILIVDDDAGDMIEEYYFAGVEGMRRGWVRWDVMRDFAPDPDVTKNYDMVIWITGNSDNPLDDLDLWQLEGAVVEGANVLLIGPRIGDQEANRYLLEHFFGARHTADSVTATSIRGLPGGRPLDENASLWLFDNDGAGNGEESPSAMIPVNNSDSLLVYHTGNEAEGVAAVYRHDARYDAKTVYMGFAFEGTGSPNFSRSAALERIYNWFTDGDHYVSPLDEADSPASFQLYPAYPNPFNSATRICFNLSNNSLYSLKVFDLSGRETADLGSGRLDAGGYSVVWAASGFPSGVYLVRLTIPGQVVMERRLVLVK